MMDYWNLIFPYDWNLNHLASNSREAVSLMRSNKATYMLSSLDTIIITDKRERYTRTNCMSKDTYNIPCGYYRSTFSIGNIVLQLVLSIQTCPEKQQQLNAMRDKSFSRFGTSSLGYKANAAVFACSLGTNRRFHLACPIRSRRYWRIWSPCKHYLFASHCLSLSRSQDLPIRRQVCIRFLSYCGDLMASIIFRFNWNNNQISDSFNFKHTETITNNKCYLNRLTIVEFTFE